MLDRLAELTRERTSLAFESTLAGLGVRDVLARCRGAGYDVHLVSLWLPSPELALARVRQRVAAGGHDIPERDVRRRWARSLVNLVDHYIPIAATWQLYDGSRPRDHPLVAAGTAGSPAVVHHASRWATITAQLHDIRGTHDP